MKLEIIINKKDISIFMDGKAVTYKNGIKYIMEYKDWSKDDMAYYLKVSSRTVEGWLYGRKPSNGVLLALHYMIQ